MNERFKRRKNYLEKNYKYLSDNEKVELERLRRLEQAEEDTNPISPVEDSPRQYEGRETPKRSRRRRKETMKAPIVPYKEDETYDDHESYDYQEEETEKKSKKKKKGKKSIWKTIRRILLVLLILLIGFFAFGYFRVKNLPTADFKAEEFNGTKTKNGATNILILGTDQRDYQATDDARSDSIMVLQIGAPDKKVKLVSFMRDTLVEIPGYSQEGWPDSKLNLSFTLGEQNGNKGAELTRQTLKKAYDIDIEYYAMVNFSSFAEVIDSMFPAGVKIDAEFSTVDGQKVSEVSVPDDLSATPENPAPEQTIKVGSQRMNGQTLLNYARFRKDDEGDFGRTKRQQQVLSAIISQAKNPATLFTGSSALGTIKALTSTDVPNSLLLTKSLPTLFNTKNGIESYTVPDLGDWQDVQDKYGGDAIQVDNEKYKQKLKNTLGE